MFLYLTCDYTALLRDIIKENDYGKIKHASVMIVDFWLKATTI